MKRINFFQTCGFSEREFKQTENRTRKCMKKAFLLPTPDEHRHTISFQHQNIQYRTELTIAFQYLNNKDDQTFV